MHNYYDEMSSGGIRRDNAYSGTLGNWIELGVGDYDHDQDHGWKFKVSAHYEDVPKAWDIVADTLVQQGIPQLASVARPEYLAKLKKAGTPAKTIFINTLRTVSPDSYMVLMNLIEKRLRESGVRPGGNLPGELPVLNSSYLSYGFDLSFTGPYYNPDNARAKKIYNPSTQPDPYRAFRVDGEVNPHARRQRDMPPLYPEGSGKKEFLRHQWGSTCAPDGSLIMYLPVVAMEFDRLERICQELKAEALDYALSFDLGFHTIHLTPLATYKLRRLQQNEPDFLQHEWQEATTQSGEKITRLPVSGMSRQDIAGLMMQLQAASLNPIEYPSESLGPTIRLKGDDVDRLHRMRSDAVTNIMPL